MKSGTLNDWALNILSAAWSVRFKCLMWVFFSNIAHSQSYWMVVHSWSDSSEKWVIRRAFDLFNSINWSALFGSIVLAIQLVSRDDLSLYLWLSLTTNRQRKHLYSTIHNNLNAEQKNLNEHTGEARRNLLKVCRVSHLGTKTVHTLPFVPFTQCSFYFFCRHRHCIDQHWCFLKYYNWFETALNSLFRGIFNF